MLLAKNCFFMQMLALVRPWEKTRYRYYYIFAANSGVA
jgi:hypothetical protein